MKSLMTVPVAAVLALASMHASADDTRMVGVVFDKGADTIEIADEVQADESVMYRLRAKEGQVLSVSLRPLDENTEFILYGPGKWPGEELHSSATDGRYDYRGQCRREGPYAVLVSRTPASAGREDEAARFELVLVLQDVDD